MKKRVFILVSTILCALVTISLVTYTVVGIFSSNKPIAEPETPPTTEVGVGSGELVSENLALNFIVGDEYDGTILSAENYVGSLLSANVSGKLVATTVGTENVTVVSGNVAYSCQINVYEKGDGSEEHPFNIIRPEDLITLVQTGIETGEYYHYAQQCDLDLSEYESWAPLGKLITPFVGAYDGNGYAVKNMNITVTKDNLSNYLDNAQTQGGSNGSMLTVGFFGFVGDPLGESVSEIKNLSIVEANISTVDIEAKSASAQIESAEYRNSLNITQSYVGVLAGYVINANVSGTEGETVSVVSSTINSSIYCDDTTSTRAGISAFIGGASSSNISGYEVKSVVTSKNAGTVKEINSGYAFYGTTIAGILGRNYNTNVADFVVELEVYAKNYQNTAIAGAVGYVVKPSADKEVSIKNIQINNLYVSMTNASYVSDKTGIIAGAVIANFNPLCVIENISVSDAVVYASTTGQISGIINTNDGVIKNCTVTGFMKGVEVSGVVNTNYGSVVWDESISDFAVDVKLVGKVKVGGVAIYNFGELKGSESLTQVKASMGWNTVTTSFESIKEEAMMAGIAVVNAGSNASVSNFYTLSYMGPATLNSGGGVINAGGVVGFFGAYTLSNGTKYEGGSINNVIANTSIQTIAGEVGESAYAGRTGVVGGIVAIVGETNVISTISNVSGNVTVNNKTDGIYGLEIYGTIIGLNNGKVEVSCGDASLNIQATVFTNYTSATTQYIGYLVGKNEGEFEIDKNTKVIISVIETANGAVVGNIN